jgi:2-C-methyl-D-erythritol 4-phosphate cytidylyltransferase
MAQVRQPFETLFFKAPHTAQVLQTMPQPSADQAPSGDAAEDARLQPSTAAGQIAAIVVAAGRGRRFGGGENKVLLQLGDRPIWRHAVEALRGCASIGEIVLVIRRDDRAAVAEAAEELDVRLVDGGQERYDSVLAGLTELRKLAQAAPNQSDASANLPQWVAVHDAARPLVPPADIDSVIAAAAQFGAAILATPIRGTIKRQAHDRTIQTVDRRELWEALTPQVFRFDVLEAAYARWRGRPVTDDAEMVERSGFPVTLVPGSAENLKITQAEDLTIAQAILSRRRSHQSQSLS